MLMFDDLQRPRLSIPEPALEASWLESSRFSRVEHRWNHYLNQLALATLMSWLEVQVAEHVQSPEQDVQVFPSPETATQRWQWVNGTAISMGERRLIVVPTNNFDSSEFHVPQEWVDIPSWAGDYYLMVQLHPEVGNLQVRGYASHCQLKLGHYDESDRAYWIDEDSLIQDIDLLWVMAELEPMAERRVDLAPLLQSSHAQVQAWVDQLRQNGQQNAACESDSPRLILPFQQWAGILDNPRFEPLLHQAFQVEEVPQQLSNVSAQLSQWFQGHFEAAWQSVEQLASPQPLWSLRNMPAQSISRGKRVTLPGISGGLELWTTVTEEVDGKVKVLVQLRHQASLSGNGIIPPLPRGIQLRLVTPNREQALQVVTARERDEYIQLKRFKVVSGQTFSVEVCFGNQRVREQFRS